MSLGPFDLGGGPFLALYTILLAVSVIASLTLSRWSRQPGRSGSLADVDQLAYLIGGGRRFSEAVAARLLAAGDLKMVERKTFHVMARSGHYSSAERRVLALPGITNWRDIEKALRSCCEPIERRLIDNGLMIGAQQANSARLRAIIPFLLLIAFGSTKWIIGMMRDRPVGILSALLILTAIAAIIRWISFDRRTQAGYDAIDAARRRASRLKIAPTHPETGLAVALFGTTVLAGSAWADFHRLRQGQGSDAGGGCGGSGGGGDSGCGGGGCGGCSG